MTSLIVSSVQPGEAQSWSYLICTSWSCSCMWLMAPTLTAQTEPSTTEPSALHQSFSCGKWKGQQLKKAGPRRGGCVGQCLFFLLWQILLRRPGSGAPHRGPLQVCSHPRQVLRKQPFLTTRSGCLWLAPTERVIARGGQAEHCMWLH